MTVVKLTKRQEKFMRDLLDMWRGEDRSIHYTELAEHVGVSRFTAYDMLKLLEEKGMVQSEYHTNGTGRGRSTVTFRPTLRAHKRFEETVSKLGTDDWDQLRDKMVDKFRAGMGPNQDMMLELIARVDSSDALSPSLQFCVELLTVILLRLDNSTFRHHLPHIYPKTDRSDPRQLILVAGFALGVLAANHASTEHDKQWEYELIEHVKQYQTIVGTLSAADRKQLAAEFNTILDKWIGDTTP